MTADTKYVKVYDNVISRSFCDHLINKFHNNKDRWETHDNEVYTFNQINLIDNKDLFEDEINQLMEVYQKSIEQYLFDCKIITAQFPEEYGFEAIRMKHYRANVGKFSPHVDASNLKDIIRFLVFFLYLDEGDGGQTILYDQEIAVDRQPGRLLMFPPTWTYPHAGQMPTGNDKHIIGSYLHYIK